MYAFAGDGWTTPVWFRAIPLPTQDCSCHRVTVVDKGLAPEDQSVVVSELHTSKLFQIKIHNLFSMMSPLDEVEPDTCSSAPKISATDGQPFRRRLFINSGCVEGAGKHKIRDSAGDGPGGKGSYTARSYALMREASAGSGVCDLAVLGRG